MTALAEEAAERLRIEVRKSMGGRRASPLLRLRALGRGYLQWAMHHPSHFKILSARDQIDLDGSVALRTSIGEVRALTEQTLTEAQQQGEVDAAHGVAELALLSRATAYGLARMQHDGHLGQWGVASGNEAAAMTGTVDLLIALMRRAPVS